jgi:hypothetical protein
LKQHRAVTEKDRWPQCLKAKSQGSISAPELSQLRCEMPGRGERES